VLTEIGFRILHFACSHRTVLRQGPYRVGPSAVQYCAQSVSGFCTLQNFYPAVTPVALGDRLTVLDFGVIQCTHALASCTMPTDGVGGLADYATLTDDRGHIDLTTKSASSYDLKQLSEPRHSKCIDTTLLSCPCTVILRFHWRMTAFDCFA
jgi:hypothetical protein